MEESPHECERPHDAAPCGQHGVQTAADDASKLDSGSARRTTVRPHDAGRKSGADACDGGQQASDAGSRGNAAPMVAELHGGGRPADCDGESLHSIRGRGRPPGALVARSDRCMEGQVTTPKIGTEGGDARSRAQARLDAKNSHLRNSLADHEERVNRRRARQPSPETRPSTAERMAALRRRVAARAEGMKNATVGDTHAPRRSADAGDQCDGSTIEVVKIHWEHGESGGEDCESSGGPVAATATGAAASAAAWHDRGRTNDASTNLGIFC